MEDGAPWRAVAEEVNRHNICRTQLSTDRLDAVLTTSDMIYMCSQGTYRHTRFLNISDREVWEALEDVKRFMQEADLPAINLSTDYFSRRDGSPAEYFRLRHIVRAYGEAVGLYFNGQCGLDTVSLTENAESVNQKNGILRRLQQGGSFAPSEVAQWIRSRNPAHAQLYLIALVREGKVRKTTRGLYEAAGE